MLSLNDLQLNLNALKLVMSLQQQFNIVINPRDTTLALTAQAALEALLNIDINVISDYNMQNISYLANAKQGWCYILAFNHPNKVLANPRLAIAALNEYEAYFRHRSILTNPTNRLHYERRNMILTVLNQMNYLYNQAPLSQQYALFVGGAKSSEDKHSAPSSTASGTYQLWTGRTIIDMAEMKHHTAGPRPT